MALVIVLLAVTACSSSGDDGGEAVLADGYEATIRRTAYGIPHITAADLGSLGFGQGYAFAEDHLCSLADQVVKARGERARWFGPGEEDANVDSDFGYRQLDLVGRAQVAWDEVYSDDAKEVISGYVAGYNAQLEEVGIDGVTGWCAGEEWVRPLDEIDLAVHLKDLALLASGTNFLDLAASAQPPTGSGGAERSARRLVPEAVGSNGWAVGAERSESGGGLLLANPHFPWTGELRLWEAHLTIPGEVDVYGATLLGVPGVLIGFNEAVAWTHTVSIGNRFTGYTLDLVDGDPTRYHYGDEERAMTSADLEVEVLGRNGRVRTERRTLWSSHYGPIVDFPGVGWTDEQTITYRDANIDNDTLIEQFLDMGRADSLEAFQEAHREHLGIPWVNTVAVSPDGRAWYADTAATPNLSPATIDDWLDERESDPFTSIAWDNGVVLLDGSDPGDEWQDDEGARSPGLIGWEHLPRLARDDFVFNANESYWLSNPDDPLTGFSPLQGEADTAQDPRTQQNALTLQGDPAAGVDELDLETFTLEEVEDALFANVGRTASNLLADVVARCDGVAAVAEACDALATWDGRYDVDAAGAALWRELMAQYPYDSIIDGEDLYAEPFDPDQPLTTPAGLAAAPVGGPDPVVQHLAAAAESLAERGFDLAAPLGDLQFAASKPGHIPVPGGVFADGTMNNVGVGADHTSTEPAFDDGEYAGEFSELTDRGYPIGGGSSFIMVVEYGEDGPRAEAILTYGQSGDPESPHFVDQTELFSTETWRPVLFDEDDVAADPELREYTVSASR